MINYTAVYLTMIFVLRVHVITMATYDENLITCATHQILIRVATDT